MTRPQLFTHVQFDAPRDIQKHLRLLARTGQLGLYLIRNPKGAGWCYVAPLSDDKITDLVVVSKPVATRDSARKDAKGRFGCVARELKFIDKYACDAVNYRRSQEPTWVVEHDPHRVVEKKLSPIDWLISQIRPIFTPKKKRGKRAA